VDPVILAQRLTRRYRRRRFVLGPVDLVLQRGGCLGVLGPADSGKTVLLKLLMGLTARNEGTLRVFGVDPQRWGLQVRSRTGLVPEGFNLPRDRTPRWFLRYVGLMWGLSPEVLGERVETVASTVGLSSLDQQPMARLDRDDLLRVGLAQALLGDPELLVFDDFPGLSPDEESRALRELSCQLIRSWQTQGRAVIVTAREAQLLPGSCTALLVLRSGKPIRWGTMEQLVESPAELEASYRRWLEEEG